MLFLSSACNVPPTAPVYTNITVKFRISCFSPLKYMFLVCLTFSYSSRHPFCYAISERINLTPNLLYRNPFTLTYDANFSCVTQIFHLRHKFFICDTNFSSVKQVFHLRWLLFRISVSKTCNSFGHSLYPNG